MRPPSSLARRTISGPSRSGWAAFPIQPLSFPRTRLRQGWAYRTAVGADLRLSADNTDAGIGEGADQLGLLAGLQLLFSRRTRLSITGEYRKSFRSEARFDVEQTELGVTGVRSIPSHQAWVSAQVIYLFNHTQRDDSTSTLDLQIGRLFTPKLGFHIDYFLPLAGLDIVDQGFRLILRIRY